MWTMSSRFSQRLNLAVTILGALISLAPIIAIQNEDKFNADDKIKFEIGSNTYIQRSPSLLASFFLVLIPAADLLLDLPAHIYSHLNRDRKSSNNLPENTVVVRLSDLERFTFIIGVSIQSSVWLLSVSANLSTFSIVYISTTNASALLALGPIITYLQRCTTTFTTVRSTAIVMTTVFGILLSVISNFKRNDLNQYWILFRMGQAFISLAGFIFASLVTLCAYKYCYLKLHSASNREALISWLRRTSTGSKNVEEQSRENDRELYTNYIPALHMVSMLTIVAAEFYMYSAKGVAQARSYEQKNYIVITAEICVLVIELRIRKNEIARGLIDLLESKKSYVRYISHELRTPLNTAFLGLKLLSSELKASKDPKDIERYDTLCDVNLSCTAAVDILNDLLCYEKLQSGILELHKENILAAPFLNGCVSMFSAQARECGVTMSITGIATPTTSDQTSQSLLPDDTIFADKFKMDQVIRNLISNALKFTPRGGSVTLKASFVQESRPKISSGFVEAARGSMRVRKKTELLSVFRHYKSNSVGVCSDVNGIGMGLQLDIDTTVEPLHGRLVVVVTDTGAGISEGNQIRLFKEIVQFNPEKLQAGGGSGLGLWITRGIVDLHDGTISASSGGEGMGSSFSVEIPMLRWPPAPLPPPTSGGSTGSGSGTGIGTGNVILPLPSLSTASSESSRLAVSTAISDFKIASSSPNDSIPAAVSFGRLSRSDLLSSGRIDATGGVLLMTDCPVPILHVLVVDDSSLNRKMLLKCLRAAGHVCTEAGDGLEAIQAVKKRIGHSTGCEGKPFDAILMDFVMPNMDGPTATKEIRALGYTAPIFGVTGNGLPADVTYFLGCGADKVLLKPLDLNKFGQAMREAIDDTL